MAFFYVVLLTIYVATNYLVWTYQSLFLRVLEDRLTQSVVAIFYLQEVSNNNWRGFVMAFNDI